MIYTLTNEVARKRALEAVQRAKQGWVVSIQPANRTTAQNSFYWATLTAISEQIRPADKTHDPDVWHTYFKAKFLPGRMIELPNGQVVEQEPSTTGLTKAQFSDYVEQVFAWATERGLTMTDEMYVMRVSSDTITHDQSPSPMGL